MTPVIFRADKKDGDITAVFPTIPSDIAGHFMTCYTHIGQHGGCSHEWYLTTRTAKPDEYHNLLSELQSVGYDDLRIYRRITRQHRNELTQEARR